MSKTTRIVTFLVSLALLFVVFIVTTGHFLPTSPQSVVLFSALVMLSFVSLFLEHFFTRPSDVLASTIAILLLLAPMESQLDQMGRWYWLFFSYNSLLFLTSLLALLLVDSSKSTAAFQNRVSQTLKRFSVFFGNGRFLFLMLFFLTLVFYVDSQSGRFLLLAAYASAVLLVNPQGFILATWRSERTPGRDVGEIFGVQSRNTFLAKLFSERKSLKRFDLVEFRYSMDDSGRVHKGMVVDNFLLNEQQWIKVLATDEVDEAIGEGHSNTSYVANVVYKIENQHEPEALMRFVGLVVEGSNIMKIRFDYGGRVAVTEGALIQAKSGGRTIVYQVTQGTTEIEALEHRNEAGLIVGEAVQLGIWNPGLLIFERYGWVPEINTPLFLATDPPAFEPAAGERLVGTLPGAGYPLLLNLRQAVTHHTAILGITGSGKSVFCRDLVRKVIDEGMKVICVDFTNEYRGKFPDLAPTGIVTPAHQAELFDAIDAISLELEKFANQQNKPLLAAKTEVLKTRFYAAVQEFLQSDRNLALFELPDVANTTGILEYTKWFFRGLFQVARQDGNFGKQVCVVLEEAHTVVPEWSFIGVDERRAQSLVNSISQIALQGRKYSIGFVVVAQRTANVSKTVLTQCNTVIAFQQFDRTSSDFLLNYMGADMVSTLPSLRFRQAIAVGKAFRSGIPVIFEVPMIEEPAAAPAA